MGRHARTPLRHPAAGQGPRLRRRRRAHADASAWAPPSPFFSVLDGVVLRPPLPRRRARWSASRTAASTTVGDGDRLSRAEVVDSIAQRLRGDRPGGAGTSAGRRSPPPAARRLRRARQGLGRHARTCSRSSACAPALGRAFRDSDVGAGAGGHHRDGLWRTRFASAPDVLSRTVRLNGVEFTDRRRHAAWLLLSRGRDGGVAGAAAGAARRRPIATTTISAPSPGSPPAPSLRSGAAGSRPRRRGAAAASARRLSRSDSGRSARCRCAIASSATCGCRLTALLVAAGVGAADRVRQRRDHGAAARRWRAGASCRSASPIGAGRGPIVRQLLTEAARPRRRSARSAACSWRRPPSPPWSRSRPPACRASTRSASICRRRSSPAAILVGRHADRRVRRRRWSRRTCAASRASSPRAGRRTRGRPARLRDALTIVEVGLAAALVICAGLTLRSLHGSAAHGARLRHRCTASASRPTSRQQAYPDAARVDQFYDQLTTRLAGAPGVRRLGSINYLPLSGEGMSDGRRPDRGERIDRHPDGLGHRARRLFRHDGHHAPARPPVRGHRSRRRAARRGRRRRARPPLVAARRRGHRPERSASAAGPRAEMRTIVGVVRHVSHTGPGRYDAADGLRAAGAGLPARHVHRDRDRRATGDGVRGRARGAGRRRSAVPLYFAETSDATLRRRRRAAPVRHRPGQRRSRRWRCCSPASASSASPATRSASARASSASGSRSAHSAPGSAAWCCGASRGWSRSASRRRSALALALGSTIGGLLYDVRPDDPSAFALAAVALGAHRDGRDDRAGPRRGPRRSRGHAQGRIVDE